MYAKYYRTLNGIFGIALKSIMMKEVLVAV